MVGESLFRTGASKFSSLAEFHIAQFSGCPLLAGRVNRELSTWRSGTSYPDDVDLIFRWERNNRDRLWLGTARIFRIAAERVDVEIGDRGAFSWRHSFATDMLGRPDRTRAQGDARPSDKNQW